MTTKKTYSFGVGLTKGLKNFLVLWGPAIIALLANVPLEYGAAAGFISYILKNYLSNK